MSDMDKPRKKSEGSRGVGRVWPLLEGLLSILVVAITAVFLSGGECPRPAGQPPRRAEEQPSDGGREEEASWATVGLEHPSLGSADAPVVMVKCGNYQ